MAFGASTFLRTAQATHAFEGGTIAREDARKPNLSSALGGICGAQMRREKTVQTLPLKDVRQGIASRRRHVAPALLLC
jgi:hypothetical protein